VRVLDLASLRAVAAFAADFQAEHGARQRTVVFNACAPMAPPTRSESADALELQFATNFLAHLLIAQELAPEGAVGTRLVWMTSMMHAASRMAVGDDLAVRRQNYDGFAAYADSKLAMVLAAAEFNRRLAGGGGASVACDPGLVDTGLARAFFLGWVPASLQPALRAPLNAASRLLLLTPTAAAATVLFAATAPAGAVGGKYVRRGAVARAAPRSSDAALAAWLLLHGGELLEVALSGRDNGQLEIIR
jgi:NAD(P)-dependent dehydrogenase (short-subunit alcohol dehydrogenase family)